MKWLLGILACSTLLALPVQAGDGVASKSQTLRLVSQTVSVRNLVDRAPKGRASKGDKQWAQSTLRNAVAQFGKPKGAVVGSDVATLTVLSLQPPKARLAVTVTLPGGSLEVAGTVSAASDRLQVVGGTGSFAGARGTGEVQDIAASPGLALNVYRLQIP